MHWLFFKDYDFETRVRLNRGSQVSCADFCWLAWGSDPGHLFRIERLTDGAAAAVPLMPVAPRWRTAGFALRSSSRRTDGTGWETSASRTRLGGSSGPTATDGGGWRGDADRHGSATSTRVCTRNRAIQRTRPVPGVPHLAVKAAQEVSSAAEQQGRRWKAAALLLCGDEAAVTTGAARVLGERGAQGTLHLLARRTSDCAWAHEDRAAAMASSSAWCGAQGNTAGVADEPGPPGTGPGAGRARAAAALSCGLLAGPRSSGARERPEAVVPGSCCGARKQQPGKRKRTRS